MKKAHSLIAFLLILCMIIPLASCEKSTLTPPEALHAALEKTFPDGYDITEELSIKFQQPGITATVTLQSTNKYNADFTALFAEGSASVMGSEIDLSLYLADGVYYVMFSVSGVSTQMKIPQEDVEDADDFPFDLSELEELVKGAKSEFEAMVSKITAEKTAEGTVYTLTVPEGSFSEAADRLSELSGFTVKVREGSLKYTVNRQGYLCGAEADLGVTADDYSLSLAGTFTVNNPGKKAELTPLADADSYVLWDEILGENFPWGIGGNWDEAYYDAYSALEDLYDGVGGRVEDFDRKLAALKVIIDEDSVDRALVDFEADLAKGSDSDDLDSETLEEQYRQLIRYTLSRLYDDQGEKVIDYDMKLTALKIIFDPERVEEIAAETEAKGEIAQYSGAYALALDLCGSFYDLEHEKVVNYDDKLEAMKVIFPPEMVEDAAEETQMYMTGLWEFEHYYNASTLVYTYLYDYNYKKVRDYDEKLAALRVIYDEDAVNYALKQMEELITEDFLSW